MESCFAITPQIANAGHDQRKQRRQKRLQIIADEKIFLLWLADDGGRIDCIAAMIDSVAVKNRIVVLKRVVTVVIAKWSFWSSFMRRRVSDQSELYFGN